MHGVGSPVRSKDGCKCPCSSLLALSLHLLTSHLLTMWNPVTRMVFHLLKIEAVHSSDDRISLLKALHTNDDTRISLHDPRRTNLKSLRVCQRCNIHILWPERQATALQATNGNFLAPFSCTFSSSGTAAKLKFGRRRVKIVQNILG